MKSEFAERAPLDVLPPHRLFGAVTDEAWRWLHLYGREQCPFLADYLPGMPGPTLEQGWVGSSGRATLDQAFDVYKLFRSLYERYAEPLSPTSRVLDFGCGFGRVSRFFLKHVRPSRLVGIDENPSIIELVPDRWTQLQRCPPLPPTRFPDSHFDLIYAFSVFSHLSEEAHLRWLEEFDRILRPAGVMILTTFRRGYMEHDPDVARRFAPIGEALNAYDRGEYCYRPLEGRKHFGFTFIPERYVREQWPFDVSEVVDAPAWGQTVIVCQRP